MRMTTRKKEILSYFEPDNLEWITGEIGAPPFDVSGVSYLLHGTSSFDKNHQLESTRRTLEAMVKDELLEKVISYERRRTRRRAGMEKVCGATAHAMVCPVNVTLCGMMVMTDAPISRAKASELINQFRVHEGAGNADRFFAITSFMCSAQASKIAISVPGHLIR